jgi:acyl-CoA reductase-like NAD-dependent aldehyde dehydrogenase
MYIAGEWRSNGAVEEVRNPYTGEVVGTAPRASAADVEQALAAAVDGAAAMRRLSAHERRSALERAAELTAAAVGELARTISAEVGKPMAEARGEASRIADLIRLSAAEGARMHGETVPVEAAPSAGDKLGLTIRQPCGVVVAVTPFNYPALLVGHKVYPALAAGNAVILKPASRTPLTAVLLTRLLLEAGLPANAIQCVTGSGADIGTALCADDRVRKISFTGSTEVGRRIASVAGIKKLSLELGANCPVVVLPDADLEATADATALGGYVNAGQVCISVQRILVDRGVYGDFLDALVPRVEAIRVGDPSSENTQLSALISEGEAQRVEATVREAVDSGAKLITGGGRSGAVVEPTVVADVDPASPLSRDELFGPAVAVTPVSGIEEAIALANDSSYGLGAGIFTSNVTNALRFARDVDCGSIQINWTPLWRADLMPYGGLKGSGIGKEGPRYAIDEMTELKVVVFHGIR